VVGRPRPHEAAARFHPYLLSAPTPINPQSYRLGAMYACPYFPWLSVEAVGSAGGRPALAVHLKSYRITPIYHRTRKNPSKTDNLKKNSFFYDFFAPN
jgi:hypothetical protein